jgi:hypothetical protein
MVAIISISVIAAVSLNAPQPSHLAPLAGADPSPTPSASATGAISAGPMRLETYDRKSWQEISGCLIDALPPGYVGRVDGEHSAWCATCDGCSGYAAGLSVLVSAGGGEGTLRHFIYSVNGVIIHNGP